MTLQGWWTQGHSFNSLEPFLAPAACSSGPWQADNCYLCTAQEKENNKFHVGCRKFTLHIQLPGDHGRAAVWGHLGSILPALPRAGSSWSGLETELLFRSCAWPGGKRAISYFDPWVTSVTQKLLVLAKIERAGKLQSLRRAAVSLCSLFALDKDTGCKALVVPSHTC